MKAVSSARLRLPGCAKLAVSAVVPLLVVAVLPAACGPTLGPRDTAQYAEYACPAPIGVIVRDDCSHATLKFDGINMGAQLSAGPVGVGAQYRDTVLREADTVVTVLKDQRESLCNNYNTCKLTREDYIREQSRIDTAFTALLSIKAGIVNMDAASATMVMQQIRDIRSGKMDAPAATESSHASTGSESGPPRPPTPDPVAQAEWGPGKYMMQAVAGVADKANKVATDSAWGFDIDGSAISGAYLDTGAKLSFVTSYEGGREYALLGQGSEGTLDLDIQVKNRTTGEVVGADTDKDATPVVQFKAPQSGEYEIEVHLAASKGSGEFVAIASMEKGGYGVPKENIIASLSRAMMGSTTANRRGGPLSFHQSGNWSLQATVLKQGETSNFGGILLETGSTIFLATGDDTAKDLNLSVQNVTTSQAVSDTDADATPVVVVPSNGASQRHKVSLSNHTSTGPSFVTLVLLDKKT